MQAIEVLYNIFRCLNRGTNRFLAHARSSIKEEEKEKREKGKLYDACIYSGINNQQPSTAI